MVVKTFILLKDPIIHEIACKQWAVATILLLISNFLSSTQEKMGDHILPLSFSDFTDCFTRIS